MHPQMMLSCLLCLVLRTIIVAATISISCCSIHITDTIGCSRETRQQLPRPHMQQHMDDRCCMLLMILMED